MTVDGQWVSMTPEELEDLAYQRQPMPNLHSQAEVLLFLSFRSLYDFALRTGMPPEQGKREKAQILEAFRINKFLEELQESTNEMWGRIEDASSNYAKKPCIETADALYEAIYKTKRKDGRG